MNIPMKDKKAEGIKRMQSICDAFNLGNKLVNYLKEDKIYYSYGYSMDTINYDERYAKAVKEFEAKHDAYVYHVIEAKTVDGNTLLSFLFVGDRKYEWNVELLNKDDIFTYTFCVEEKGYEDMGWIRLDSPMGYLMRIA